MSIGEILTNKKHNVPGEIFLHGAVAIELLAFAAYIVDDIVDQDNNQLPWRQVPSSVAIHLAICLITLKYKALFAVQADDVVHNMNIYGKANEILQQMCLRGCEGQIR